MVAAVIMMVMIMNQKTHKNRDTVGVWDDDSAAASAAAMWDDGSAAASAAASRKFGIVS